VNIDSLESRASVNEADLVVLKNRADSNASRLIVNDSELSALEAYVDSLEGRMSTAEVNIVDLENSFTVYEADVVDIKGTLYAISDGNIESMLSSLQEIKDSFESNTNIAEDMAELNSRLTELISVVQELTE
jgi:chromosome segregation ATPase